MVEDTENASDRDGAPDAAGAESDEELRTSGHVERTILHAMGGDDLDRYRPTTVSDVLDDIVAVVARGDYDNVGPRSPKPTVRKSTVRRAFSQLREKGLVQRVADLDAAALRSARFDLGSPGPDGDPSDPADYSLTSDDARVTDWILTDEGAREVERLDARFAAELDDLAARYGRPPGETTARIANRGADR